MSASRLLAVLKPALLNRQALHKLLLSLVLIISSWTMIGCTPAGNSALGETPSMVASEISTVEGSTVQATPTEGNQATAIFAGGCFWCMEQPFDELPGVNQTLSGYTGGEVENPTYYQVSSGDTGHVEAMQVTYDPAQTSYEQLLETFWHNIDPLDDQGQFCDKGSQYRSAIFTDTPDQTALAEESKAAIADRLNQPVATEILSTSKFYPAEDYHQNYYQTRPVRYKVYRFGCGRDQRLSELWGADAPQH